MSSSSPAAAASADSTVAGKKASRRKASAVSLARSAKPPTLAWYAAVHETLGESEALKRITVVNAKASGLVSTALPAFVRKRLLPRAQHFRRHACSDRLKPEHIEAALLSLTVCLTDEERAPLLVMIRQAHADKDAFLASRAKESA